MVRATTFFCGFFVSFFLPQSKKNPKKDIYIFRVLKYFATLTPTEKKKRGAFLEPIPCKKGTNALRRPLLRRGGGGGGGQREERASPSSRHHHHHHHARRGVRETLVVVVDVGEEGLCRPRKMEALQSPQCDDDDDANATTTGKKHHHHPSDGEEREQKLQRRTGRVRVSKVPRRKLARLSLSERRACF